MTTVKHQRRYRLELYNEGFPYGEEGELKTFLSAPGRAPNVLVACVVFGSARVNGRTVNRGDERLSKRLDVLREPTQNSNGNREPTTVFGQTV